MKLNQKIAVPIAALTAIIVAFGSATVARADSKSDAADFLRHSLVNGQYLDGFSAGSPEFGFSLEALLQLSQYSSTKNELGAAKNYLLKDDRIIGSASGKNGYAFDSQSKTLNPAAAAKFAFVSAVREFFDGLIVIGGGISDGAGVAGAITCGADLVYMGTRFIPTLESRADPEYKQMLVDCTAEDLLVSSALTGTAASWLKPSLKRVGFDPAHMPEAPERHYDSNQSFAAKRWVDVWAAGQGLGSIHGIEPVSEVVTRLAQQYQQALARMSRHAITD